MTPQLPTSYPTKWSKESWKVVTGPNLCRYDKGFCITLSMANLTSKKRCLITIRLKQYFFVKFPIQMSTVDNILDIWFEYPAFNLKRKITGACFFPSKGQPTRENSASQLSQYSTQPFHFYSVQRFTIMQFMLLKVHYVFSHAY